MTTPVPFSSNVKPILLIVDDQPINIRLLYELFNDECDVYMASSGENALEKAKELLPDLILLDVVMPGLNGYDVCRKIKSDPLTASIPVVFVTGHYDEADEVQGFECGAVDFIHKPINPVITRARIQNQLLLKRQSDFLRSLAFIDGLTGIANRLKFDKAIERAWLQCVRDKNPISLIMIDVDHFKKYNDEYGHQAGDDCLRAVAESISQSLSRPYDLVARYGGEEFVCLLPSTSSEGALLIAEKIKQSVQDKALEHKQSESYGVVTISLGCATTFPISGAGSEQLIAKADEQLYAAKNKGRCCVNAISFDCSLAINDDK